MQSYRHTALIVLLLACSACSTVIEGRTQQISVNTSPEGATCVLKSNDDVLGVVPSTPGIATIVKSKNDILVECTKDGYVKAKKKNLSDVALTGLGNMAMLQLSFVGNMFDSATGASHKYDSQVFMELEKDYNTAQTPPPAPQLAQLPPQQQPMQMMILIPASQLAIQPMPETSIAAMQTQQVAQLMPELTLQESTLKPPFAIEQ